MKELPCYVMRAGRRFQDEQRITITTLQSMVNSDKLLKLSSLNPRIRALQRRLIGYAEDVEMDAAGRVLISSALRNYAVLDKRVMLIGQGNKFELWDEAKWTAQQEAELSFANGPKLI